MAISPKLELRQSQSLVMTPQLQQAIKLLQMSNIELSAFVEQELERNPLLEREDDHAPEAEAAAPEVETAAPEAPLLDSTGGDDGPLDVEVDNTFTNDTLSEDGRITSYNVCYTKLLRFLPPPPPSTRESPPTSPPHATCSKRRPRR